MLWQRCLGLWCFMVGIPFFIGVPHPPLPSSGSHLAVNRAAETEHNSVQMWAGLTSSCRDLFPTPSCAAAEWQWARGLLDTLCLFEGRNSLFCLAETQSPLLLALAGEQEVRARAAALPREGSIPSQPCSRSRRGGTRTGTCWGRQKAASASPWLKLERNGSILDSFRGEGKLRNEDDLKE